MGSGIFDTLKEHGRAIRRGGGETMVALPEEFAIIGLDITPEKLAALYPDDSKPHARARAIIAGIRDKTRVIPSKVPAAFVATFRRGCEEPISIANLGPDRKGKLWIVTAKGRNRNMALRQWNAEHPTATWEITGILKPFVHNDKAGIDAELEALESNAASNVFVAEAPSTKADRAVMLSAKGKSDADIAINIGARDAVEVIFLRTLAECCDEVKNAIDEGRIGLVAVEDLAKHNHEEQARRVAKRTAPNKAARNAVPTRLKARPPAVRAAFVAYLQPSADEDSKSKAPVALFSALDVHALARWLGGDDEAIRDAGVSEEMRAAVKAAMGKVKS